MPVVDVGADFRLGAEAYPVWYGFEHPAPEWLAKAVYGLTERPRDAVRGAVLVANPGCYPTPVGLGLAPLFAAGLLQAAGTGHRGREVRITGAGKEPTPQSHFAALDGSVRAYRVGRHQHTPEMEVVLGGGSSVTFVPHLVPAVSGVVTTCYARVAAGTSEAALLETLAATYVGEPFVRVLAAGETPDPRRLAGTNVCELSAHVDAHAGMAVVIGAVDNLGKGAAGQAIQNLNVMLGLDETDWPPWGCTRERHRAARLRRGRGLRRAQGERAARPGAAGLRVAGVGRRRCSRATRFRRRRWSSADGAWPGVPPGRRREQRSGQRRHRPRGAGGRRGAHATAAWRSGGRRTRSSPARRE